MKGGLAYLGISQSKRKQLEVEVQQIKEALQTCNMHIQIFVDDYVYQPGQDEQMMQAAFRQIEAADLLIVELSHKAIGVGVEVGFAYAKKIPIIYLKHQSAKWSTTVGGCASHVIEYDHPVDLKTKLVDKLRKM